MTRYSNHRKIFHEHFGFGPWPCEMCDDEITQLGRRRDDGQIHHRNEDKLDNRPENLVVLHFKCHRRHHMYGVPMKPEVREKIRAANTGHEVSEETRKKIGDANRGNTYSVGRAVSDETRRKISESVAHQRKATCADCGLTTRPGSLVSHLRKTGHKEAA